MWHSHKLLPRGFGVAASIQQLERELTFGPNFGSFWFAHLSRMIACFLFFLGAWAIGQSVFPWFLNRSSGDDRARLGLPFSIGLGLGVLGYLSFALSMCGLTQRWIVSSLYLAICSFGIWRVIPAFRISRSARGTVAAHSGPSFLEKTTFAVFIALIAMAFLGSTSPEIFYDSLTYHLAVPQTYLFAGKIVDMPYNHYSYLPLLISMLYFWGLAVGGMYLAKLMSFSLGLCVLLGLYQWGKVLGGRAVGIIACTVFMGTPLVLYLFWVCNSDLGMAFFLLLALMATWRWSCELETNQRMLYLAGIFAGLAVASKYTAVVGVVVLMAFVAWRSWRKRPAAPFLFFLVAMMPLIPWWIRTYEFTGNPFFPYLVSAFGPKDADQSLLALWYQETRAGTAGIHPFVIMKKIWTDAIYGALPPLNYTGAIFVAFSPIILFVQQMPWMRFVSLYCCITLLAGLSMTHITRLLVPFYLPLSLVVAFALISERHRYARAASVLLISALLFNTHRFVMVMLLTSLKGLSVATGRMTPSDYLKQERDLYPSPPFGAYEFITSLKLPAHDRILLIGESRVFYSPNLAIGNGPYDVPVIFSWADALNSPDELYEKMKTGNIRVIILNPSESDRNDSRKYITAAAGTNIRQMLGLHFEKVYQDSWTRVFYRKI